MVKAGKAITYLGGLSASGVFAYFTACIAAPIFAPLAFIFGSIMTYGAASTNQASKYLAKPKTVKSNPKVINNQKSGLESIVKSEKINTNDFTDRVYTNLDSDIRDDNTAKDLLNNYCKNWNKYFMNYPPKTKEEYNLLVNTAAEEINEKAREKVNPVPTSTSAPAYIS
ncbi:MAG: hypothetical protein JW791_04330 [Nanoarchaeota archaeon]|nr:hypothetical protein [Nanoarchaeota archaeon]